MKNVIVVGGNSMADLRNGIEAALAAMGKGGMMYCVGASTPAELRKVAEMLDGVGANPIITESDECKCCCGCYCDTCDCGGEDEGEAYTDEDVDDAYENGYEDGYADAMNEMADTEDEDAKPPKSAEEELTDKAKAYFEMLCGMLGVDPSKYGR